jgi:hypothetical protein
VLIRITPIEVGSKLPEPIPTPLAITKNINPKSDGFLIGVLNLTIDKAPTNPRDSASDDFTKITTSVVLSPDSINNLVDKTEENLLPFSMLKIVNLINKYCTKI